MAGPDMRCTLGGFSLPCALAACALEQVHRGVSLVKWPGIIRVQLLSLGLTGLPEPSKMTSQPSPTVPTIEDTPPFTPEQLAWIDHLVAARQGQTA